MTRIFLLLFPVLFFLPPHAAATAEKKADSVLQTYYLRCRNNVEHRSVLATADTLFRLAAARHDADMQIAALKCKALFYSHADRPDTLRMLLTQIEPLARENDRLSDYYTTWTRLISLYTELTQYSLARFEIRQLITQAEKDDYKPATAQAYTQLAQIYRTRRLWQPASHYCRRAIDFILRNGIDRYSVSNLYCQLANSLSCLGRYDEALEALQKASEHLTQPKNRWNILCREAEIRAQLGQKRQALSLLGRLAANTDWNVPPLRLLGTRSNVFLHLGDYARAQQSLDSLFAAYDSLHIREQHYYELFLDRAHVRRALGDPAGAYADLQHYTALYEQRVSEQSETTLNEFATLMDVTLLNREKARLEKEAQSAQLKHTRSLVFALSAVVLLSLLFILLLGRLNRKLSQAKKAAEEVSRMKGIFIQHMTHEFNTPLNAIVGFAELAAGEEDAAERRSYLEIIRSNSDSLQKLMDDVLYISAIESTDTPPQLVLTEINRCCLRAVERVRGSVAQGVALEFRPGRESLLVMTSHAYLQQLLADLLHNAVKFTRNGSIVLSYRVAPDGSSVEFSVTDTGCGIPASQAERIFERFVKLDAFRPGVGLGLSLCRLIAQKLGGRIYLDKSYRNGARFVFILPVP